MIEQFYLLTKDLGFSPGLIGILKRDDSCEYTFEYLFNGDNFPEYDFIMEGMKDAHKVYKGEEVYRNMLSWFIPKPNTQEAYHIEKA